MEDISARRLVCCVTLPCAYCAYCFACREELLLDWRIVSYGISVSPFFITIKNAEFGTFREGGWGRREEFWKLKGIRA